MKKLLIVFVLLSLVAPVVFSDREEREELEKIEKMLREFQIPEASSPRLDYYRNLQLSPDVSYTSVAYKVSVPEAFVIPEEYRELGSSIAALIAEELEKNSAIDAVSPEEMDNPKLLYDLAASGFRKDMLATQSEEIGLLCAAIVDYSNGVFILRVTVYESSTGEVLSKELLSEEGSVLVLTDMAREIGRTIKARSKEWPVMMTEAPEEAVEDDPPPAAESTPTPVSARERSEREKPDERHYSHLVISGVFPAFNGSAPGLIEDVHDADVGEGAYTLNGGGIDFHLLVDLRNYLYIGLGIGMLSQEFEWDDGDYTVDDFSVTDARLTAGGLIPLSKRFIAYIGAGLTYTTFTLEEYWYYFDMDGNSESGMGFCLETGADIIFGHFCITPKVTFTRVAGLSTGEIFSESQDLSLLYFSLGAGISL